MRRRLVGVMTGFALPATRCGGGGMAAAAAAARRGGGAGVGPASSSGASTSRPFRALAARAGGALALGPHSHHFHRPVLAAVAAGPPSAPAPTPPGSSAPGTTGGARHQSAYPAHAPPQPPAPASSSRAAPPAGAGPSAAAAPASARGPPPPPPGRGAGAPPAPRPAGTFAPAGARLPSTPVPARRAPAKRAPSGPFAPPQTAASGAPPAIEPALPPPGSAAATPLNDAARRSLLGVPAPGTAATEVETMRDGLLARGITLKRYSPGEQRMVCPKCGGGSSAEHCFSITIDPDGQTAKWKCFRATCGFQGGYTVGSPYRPATSPALIPAGKKNAAPPVKPDTSKFRPLDPAQVAFFAARGISKATLDRNGVMCADAYFAPLSGTAPAVAFPYKRDGEVVNVKFRSEKKHFTQVRGAEKVLYGLDDVVGQADIIIVEGEMDKLALEEAGFTNVVSVPDGAPRDVKEGALPDPDEDVKFSYLWASRGVLDMAARIIIATDSDGPGQALSEELARRLGRERCWRVKWPVAEADAAAGGKAPPLKDANEVLLARGPDALKAAVEGAEPYPIRGLFSFADFESEIWASYVDQKTDVQGVSTGWEALDSLYRVVPGELTIVTGIPNSGKSEWIDALMVNLSQHEGWSFALCSLEKKARDHARQLLEKHTGKPFFDNANYSAGQARMTQDEVAAGLDWLADRFFIIRYEDEALPSVEWVLEIARVAVLRYGIRGLVIDPYNELDHQRHSSMSETEYVSQMLTKIKRFAQHNDVHVWFVAHPKQLQQWKGDAPNLYDISGSAHFVNKADAGIVVHRVRNENGPNDKVQILVRKVRNKAAGMIGEAFLKYDRTNGCYADVPAHELE